MPNRPQPRFLQALFVAGAAAWLAGKPRRPTHSLLWSAVLLAADLVAIPAILRAKAPISGAELATLRPDRIPSFDRIALQLPSENREPIRKSSDQVLRIMVAAPFLLLFSKKLRRNTGFRLPDYVWGHALTYTIYTFSPLGPAFVDKYRPVVYRAEAPVEARSNGNNRNSQYSGHTGNAAFASFFLARSLSRLSKPDSGAKPVIYGLACIGALMLGSLRVRAQKHFPSDVLLATGIGALLTTVLPEKR